MAKRNRASASVGFSRLDDRMQMQMQVLQNTELENIYIR